MQSTKKYTFLAHVKQQTNITNKRMAKIIPKDSNCFLKNMLYIMCLVTKYPGSRSIHVITTISRTNTGVHPTVRTREQPSKSVVHFQRVFNLLHCLGQSKNKKILKGQESIQILTFCRTYTLSIQIGRLISCWHLVLQYVFLNTCHVSNPSSCSKPLSA